MTHAHPYPSQREGHVTHQLASDFYAGWNGAAPAGSARPGVIDRILRRLGLVGRADFASTTVMPIDSQPARLEHAFFRAGEDILRRARQAAQPVCVLVLQLHDLPELGHVFGSKPAQQVIDQTMARLKQVAGRKGLARQIGESTFAALVPQVWLDGALEAFFSAFGRTCCIEVESAGEEIVLVPDFKIRAVREGATIQITYEILCREIATARDNMQRRLEYLQRERASHSTPMRLRRDRPRPRPSEYANNIVERDLHAPEAATVPVQIARR
jgi:GGDEF domain-containing protein